MPPAEPNAGEVTLLLAKLRTGGDDAAGQLLPLIYNELKKLAGSYMRRERPDHTLQATALVHEAFIKMTGQDAAAFENRAHFFGVAAQVMRHILVDHARGKNSHKRGGLAPKVPLDERLSISVEQSDEVLALHEALERLEKLSPRQAKIVEMRYFAGLSIAEIAEALGVVTRTVHREWGVAQAWLRKELE